MITIKIYMAYITHAIIYLVIVVQVLQFAISFRLRCKEYIHVYIYICARAYMYTYKRMNCYCLVEKILLKLFLFYEEPVCIYAYIENL